MLLDVVLFLSAAVLFVFVCIVCRRWKIARTRAIIIEYSTYQSTVMAGTELYNYVQGFGLEHFFEAAMDELVTEGTFRVVIEDLRYTSGVRERPLSSQRRLRLVG